MGRGRVLVPVLLAVVFVGALAVETPFQKMQRKARKEGRKESAQDDKPERRDGIFDLNLDEGYKMLSRTLEGEDSFNILKDMLSHPDVDAIFANASDALLILQNVPSFKMIKGVNDLISNPDTFTAEHSLQILDMTRNFVEKGAKLMTQMREPTGFADLLSTYASGDDPVINQLIQEINNGNQDAFKELQETVLSGVLGDALDTGFLNLSGKESDVIKEMRESVLNNPYISKYIEQDSILAADLADPLGPLKKAVKFVNADGTTQ